MNIYLNYILVTLNILAVILIIVHNVRKTKNSNDLKTVNYIAIKKLAIATISVGILVAIWNYYEIKQNIVPDSDTKIVAQEVKTGILFGISYFGLAIMTLISIPVLHKYKQTLYNRNYINDNKIE
jgi:hypothetical protein